MNPRQVAGEGWEMKDDVWYNVQRRWLEKCFFQDEAGHVANRETRSLEAL